MTDSEINLLAICAWKENRHGQIPGMTSIINVVMNRMAKHGKTVEEIVYAPNQFTSMSVASDPEYRIHPLSSHGVDLAAWNEAETLAQQAAQGALQDITNSSTLYYAPKSIKTNRTFTLPSGEIVPFPQTWNPKVVRYEATIADQLFFVET